MSDHNCGIPQLEVKHKSLRQLMPLHRISVSMLNRKFGRKVFSVSYAEYSHDPGMRLGLNQCSSLTPSHSHHDVYSLFLRCGRSRDVPKNGSFGVCGE
jgi:hypothetical protein